MNEKRYYSERHNLRQRDKYDENDLSTLFVQSYHELYKQKIFRELVGYTDTWGNSFTGLIANSYAAFVFKRLGKEDLIPISDEYSYSEEDVFDLIELFYDYASLPNALNEATYEKIAGQSIFRKEMNGILNNYHTGYELTEEGYIRNLVNNGLEGILDSKQKFIDDDISEDAVQVAKKKFFHYKADESDKKGAILEIGGVLEKLKKSNQLKLHKQDETELFDVLNNFNLRHNRPDQKPNYDKDIYYPWVFHNLLSALDANLKLQKTPEFYF